MHYSLKILLDETHPVPVNYSNFAELENYQADSSLSQSVLKNLPDSLVQGYAKPAKRGMLLGSYADALLTRPYGEADALFHVFKEKAPTEGVLKVVELLLEKFEVEQIKMDKLSEKELNDYILEACDEADYRKTNKPDTRIGYILPAIPYMQERQANSHKVEISEETYSQASTAAMKIRTSPHTKFLFEENPDLVTFFQWPIIGEVMVVGLDGKEFSIPAKGCLDQVQVDHQNRRIRVFDFKVLGYQHHTAFEDQWRRFRLDLQSFWYLSIINNALQKVGKGDYILEFTFVVQTYIGSYPPVLWTMINEDVPLMVGGFVSHIPNSHGDPMILHNKKGIADMLMDWEHYSRQLENGEEFVPRELIENNFTFPISWMSRQPQS